MSSHVQRHLVVSHFTSSPFSNNTNSTNSKSIDLYHSKENIQECSPAQLHTKPIDLVQPVTPLSSTKKSSHCCAPTFTIVDSVTVSRVNSENSDAAKHFQYNFVSASRSFSSNSSRFSLSSSSRSMEIPNRNVYTDKEDFGEEKKPTECVTLQSSPATLVSRPPPPPPPSSSSPSPLMAFLNEAVKSGFTIQAQKRELGRHKRPVMLPGYSIRDWHSKLELRKARLSASIPSRRISRPEIQQHNTVESLWVVIRGVVYDVTEFQRFHPSFDNVLAKCGGHDITSLIDVFHPWISVQSFLVTYALGLLEVE